MCGLPYPLLIRSLPTLQMHRRGAIVQKHVDVVTEAPHIFLSCPTDLLSAHFPWSDSTIRLARGLLPTFPFFLFSQ